MPELKEDSEPSLCFVCLRAGVPPTEDAEVHAKRWYWLVWKDSSNPAREASQVQFCSLVLLNLKGIRRFNADRLFSHAVHGLICPPLATLITVASRSPAPCILGFWGSTPHRCMTLPVKVGLNMANVFWHLGHVQYPISDSSYSLSCTACSNLRCHWYYLNRSGGYVNREGWSGLSQC